MDEAPGPGRTETPAVQMVCPDSRRPERRYAAEVLLEELLGFGTEIRFEDRERVLIEAPEGGRVLVADDLLATPPDRWLSEGSVPSPPLAVWDTAGTVFEACGVDREIPVLYGDRLDDGAFASTGETTVELGVDLFGSAFFMLTRYEEVADPVGDDHGRFPATASVAHAGGFLERPIVDEHAEVLRTALEQAGIASPPSPHRYRVCPSHDVDRIGQGVLGPAGAVARMLLDDLAVRKSPRMALRRVAATARARTTGGLDDVVGTFDGIIDASDARGLRSVFYFKAGHTQEVPMDRYDLGDTRVQELMARIGDRGHEVGFHPSYRTVDDPGLLRDEHARFCEACRDAGVNPGDLTSRQHYLRFDVPRTWRMLADVGVACDSTLTFADHAGFRCGTAREHPVFDVEQRRPLPIRERPLVAMEATLFNPGYMGLDGDAGVERLGTLADRCRRYNGAMRFLWHNDRLEGPDGLDRYLAALDRMTGGDDSGDGGGT